MKFLIFAATIVLALAAESSIASNACQDVLGNKASDDEIRLAASDFSKSQELAAVALAIRSLPLKGSTAWQKIVTQIKLEMNVNDGIGYVLVDLREYLPIKLFESLHGTFAHPSQFWIDSKNPESTGRLLVHGWEVALGKKDVEFGTEVNMTFKQLSDWLEGIISAALPGENTKGNLALVRISTKHGGMAAEQWHADHNYVTAAITLMGPLGTQIKAKGLEDVIEVPPGVLAVFSGQARHATYSNIVPTVHKSPPDSARVDRMFFMWRSGN